MFESGNSLPSKSRWRVDLPVIETDSFQHGGCRSLEGTYERWESIGRGTYGEVFRGHAFRRPQDLVALKKIGADSEDGVHITALKEIMLLRRLSNESIIGLREVVRSQTHPYNGMKGSIYLVLEFMDCDLRSLIKSSKVRMKSRQVQSYMLQFLRGLGFCHKQGVLHRDLTTSNLLVNSQGQLKIADFGLAHVMSDGCTGLSCNVITIWNRPLELLLGCCHYGPEIDIWSAGCVFAELLTGYPLFPGIDKQDQMEKICQVLGSPTETTMPGVTSLPGHHLLNTSHWRNNLEDIMRYRGVTDPAALRLLHNLLQLTPSKRITASQALEDEFFDAVWLAPNEPWSVSTCLALQKKSSMKSDIQLKRKHSCIIPT